jgi:hypothetical protein
MGLFKPFIGDVFGLSRIYDLQVENIDNKNFASWPESAKYGYFGGGYFFPGSPPGTNMCTITRLDFSNETVSDPGKNFVVGKRGPSVVSNNSYGYFGGSYLPSSNTITRLDFSNETVSDPGKNFVEVSRNSMAGVSNNSYGYFGGGFDTSTISRLDFSNETIFNPTNNLLIIRYQAASVSNNSYGYFGGGGSPAGTTINTITRLDFSNETVSDPTKNLPTARRRISSISNNSYGYFGGGYIFPSMPYLYSTISRLDFSNETVSDPGKNFVVERNRTAGVSNNSYGYFGGGSNSTSTSSQIATITRLDFSNETVSDPGKNFVVARYDLAGLSGGASVLRPNKTYGYFAGGDALPPPPTLNIITKLDFSSETVSNAANITANKSFTGVSNNSYGYFAGGYFGTSCTITRLDFSNETVSLPAKNLLNAKGNAGGVSNNSYGYFAGGNNPPPVPTNNTINRLDFSNETVSNPGKNMSYEKGYMAGVSNNSYGYFAGGYNGSATDGAIVKLDFSNETVSNPGKNLVGQRFSAAGVSNNSYGYIAGGYNSNSFPNTRYSTITRLDFSNETVSDPGKNLPTERDKVAGVSNNSYGYFGGGFSIGGHISTIARLDFSNETVNNTVNNFNIGRSDTAAVTNSN